MNAKIDRQMMKTAKTIEFESNNQVIVGESNHLELLNEGKPPLNVSFIDGSASPP